MKNVELSVFDNILTIRIDLSKEVGPSKSGKSIIIATTEGNQPLTVKKDSDMKLGLNLFRSTVKTSEESQQPPQEG